MLRTAPAVDFAFLFCPQGLAGDSILRLAALHRIYGTLEKGVGPNQPYEMNRRGKARFNSTSTCRRAWIRASLYSVTAVQAHEKVPRTDDTGTRACPRLAFPCHFLCARSTCNVASVAKAALSTRRQLSLTRSLRSLILCFLSFALLTDRREHFYYMSHVVEQFYYMSCILPMT